jgi:uncharacterized cupin superfamily protein
MPRPFVKAQRQTIHGGKLKVVRWIHPPNSTTGRHTESREYIVVPLTSGTLERRVYNGQAPIVTNTVRLKPYDTFVRRGGRAISHELINKTKKKIVILKFYGG